MIEMSGSSASHQTDDIPGADLGQQQDVDGDDFTGIAFDSEDEEFLMQALDESMGDVVCPLEEESFHGMLP